MDALKKMYEQLNFENVQTYVQSGNVIFSSAEQKPQKLEKIISSKIEFEFGLEVPVIVLNTTMLKIIIENNPFPKEKNKDTKFLHVTFLSGRSAGFDEESIIEKKQPGEEIVFTSEAVYLFCPNGYGKTKLNNNFLESRLKVKATTRNWKTTTELLKLATE